jgi:hypothetical protein
MTIVICPGIHDSALTKRFVSHLLEFYPTSSTKVNYVNTLIFPAEGIFPLSGFHILQFLQSNLSNQIQSPLIFISFSAGVVGGITAANIWRLSGGHVKAFIAIDGWGVPLYGDFPIHRLSHDYFTHWTSLLLGSGVDNFYADPPVEHLQIWENPNAVKGIWTNSLTQRYLSVSDFLYMLFSRYK